jgi:hypothetical protein
LKKRLLHPSCLSILSSCSANTSVLSAQQLTEAKINQLEKQLPAYTLAEKTAGKKWKHYPD